MIFGDYKDKFSNDVDKFRFNKIEKIKIILINIKKVVN